MGVNTWDLKVCTLFRSFFSLCSFFGVSFIGGSTQMGLCHLRKPAGWLLFFFFNVELTLSITRLLATTKTLRHGVATILQALGMNHTNYATM